MDFALFLLVNFMLFLRPAEIVPALEALPLYNYCILVALAVSFPRIVDNLNPSRLSRQPITFCVLGLLAAVVMSHLAHFDTWMARHKGSDFGKIVMYYLVLISAVNSASRLRSFLYTVAILATISAAIAILHYYEYIEVPSLSVLEYSEGVDPETGAPIMLRRLRATGIFNDPNDLAMIAVVGIVISLLGIGDRGLGFLRLAWAAPLAVLGAALFLTQSRGGTLALGAAIAALSYSRFGFWKTLIPVALFVPVAAAVFAGRGSAMDEGTGHARVELWSAGLVLLKQHPVFGIGAGMYGVEVGQVAHNSFVQSFTELGFFGGALFLGAFWFGALGLWKLGRPQFAFYQQSVDPSFRRMRPYILAILIGAAASMMSISRQFVVPTYMLLGIACVYALELQRQGQPAPVDLTPGRLFSLLPLSAAFIVLTQAYILVSVR